MAKPNIHAATNNGKWVVKQEGNPQPLSTHRTQKTAIDAGRKVAKADGVELVIHRPNGQIRDKDSYGNDPCPPKDKD